MIKSSLFGPSILVTMTIFATVLVSGCQTSLGPWERQAYAPPSIETPVNKVKITPGSPLPFEQRLPTGNLNAPPLFGTGP